MGWPLGCRIRFIFMAALPQMMKWAVFGKYSSCCVQEYRTDRELHPPDMDSRLVSTWKKIQNSSTRNAVFGINPPCESAANRIHPEHFGAACSKPPGSLADARAPRGLRALLLFALRKCRAKSRWRGRDGRGGSDAADGRTAADRGHLSRIQRDVVFSGGRAV